jgi:hypothetical protein
MVLLAISAYLVCGPEGEEEGGMCTPLNPFESLVVIIIIIVLRSFY